MGKIYTIDEITAAVKPIAEKYGIDKVWLFGSYARGEATEKSDVDLLISYQNLIGMFALGGVYSDMEDAFNKPVDIVSERALTASYASVSSIDECKKGRYSDLWQKAISQSLSTSYRIVMKYKQQCYGSGIIWIHSSMI